MNYPGAQEEFVLIARYVFAAVVIVSALVLAPPLFSAANNAAVFTALVMVAGSIIAAATSVAGRMDKTFKKAFRMIRDAFFT